ncbi:hypothetical protein A5884_002883, partial [Enterococcus sp. 7D2_DIV0200]
LLLDFSNIIEMGDTAWENYILMKKDRKKQ